MLAETEYKTIRQLTRIADALEIANRLKIIEIKTKGITVGTYNELMEIEEQLPPEHQSQLSSPFI